MKEYSLVIVIWKDHLRIDRARLPKSPSSVMETSLSTGLLIDEDDEAIVLVSDIERYQEHDDCTYLVLFKSTILSIKKYGKIKINKLRK